MNHPRRDSECPSCGFPLDPDRQVECPKCGTSIRAGSLFGLLEVDVAHSGESWEGARQKIEQAVDRAIHRGHAGVKIIHGHGAATGRAIIAPRAVALMKQLAAQTGGTFTKDRHNQGAHLIWFNG